jgi:hypothetical protein
MLIKKILGSLTLKHGNLAIAKLANGYYAVGNLFYGKDVKEDEQINDFDHAFEKWSDTIDALPVSEFE